MAATHYSGLKRMVERIKLLGQNSKKDKVVEDLYALARILANMMIIATEKRRNCMYYNTEKGYCRFIGLETPIHGIEMVFDENTRRWRIVVLKHPEVCAVCPYWEPRR